MRLYRSKKVRIGNKHWGVASKKWCVVNCSQQHCRTSDFIHFIPNVWHKLKQSRELLWEVFGDWCQKELTSCLKHPKTSWTMLDHGVISRRNPPTEGAAAWSQHNVQIHRFDPTCPQHVLSQSDESSLRLMRNTQRHWHLPMRHLMTTQSFSGAIWLILIFDIFIRIGLFQYIFDSFCMFWDQKSNILLNFEKSSLTCTVCI